MTRVLLDTHALIWALTAPIRLGPDAADVIRSRSSELVVSAASAWELATKVRVGKLPAAARIVDSYSEALDRLGATTLAVSDRHALLAGSMRWDHRDPFDRMLAAQSFVEDLPLVTADGVFTEAPGVRVRW